jgi:PTH2 family peptidyl-tRNA hydrolase
MYDMKQLIIARKDLQMSPGKLAAQVSHASMAFLTTMIKEHYWQHPILGDVYCTELFLPKNIMEGWILGSFTKIICEAKNRSQLMKAVTIANDLGMKEGKDFFLIKDNCYTELEPEETDENGIGRTLTCIGFRPLDREVYQQISKKYQLYR